MLHRPRRAARSGRPVLPAATASAVAIAVAPAASAEVSVLAPAPAASVTVASALPVVPTPEVNAATPGASTDAAQPVVDQPPGKVTLAVSPWGGHGRWAPCGCGATLTQLTLAPGKHVIAISNADAPVYRKTINVKSGADMLSSTVLIKGMSVYVDSLSPCLARRHGCGFADALRLRHQEFIHFARCATPPAVASAPAEPAVVAPPKVEVTPETVLAQGVKAYQAAQYQQAELDLKSALQMGLSSPADVASANKHLAFIFAPASAKRNVWLRSRLHVRPIPNLL